MTDGETLHLRVTGSLDALTVSELVPLLDDLLQGPENRWVLDLSQLRMIDSTGVGTIIYAYKKLRDRAGTLSIEGATAQPLAILRLMRLDRVFGPPAPQLPSGH
jgi:anti-sigma B factor antagonist